MSRSFINTERSKKTINKLENSGIIIIIIMPSMANNSNDITTRKRVLESKDGVVSGGRRGAQSRRL